MAGAYFVNDYPTVKVFYTEGLDVMKVYTGARGWLDVDPEGIQYIVNQAHNGDLDGPLEEPPPGVPVPV